MSYSSLFQRNAPRRQNVAPCPLRRAHILHHRSLGPSLHQQSLRALAPLVRRPLLPRGTVRIAGRIRIKRRDEANPVLLHQAGNLVVRPTGLVRLGQASAPDDAVLGHMRHAVPVPDGVRVFDVVAVVEIVGDAVARIHAAEKDARADVAELGVRGTRGAPVFPRVGKRFGGGVEADEPVELGGVDGWELGLDPVFGVLRGGNVSRHKNRAFVRIITIETSLSINPSNGG